MNPFLLSQTERQAKWKEVRTGLCGLSEPDQLKSVATFWAQAPLSNTSYDLHQPEGWPTPWEMLRANVWCRHSRAIGMEFTLRLGGWDASRLKLILANDLNISDTIFVLEIDRTTILNYDLGNTVTLPNRQWEIIAEWQFTGKFFTTVGE